MANSVTVEVHGLPEVLAKLESASVKMRRVISRRAVVAGARVIARQARANAPRRTGVLRRALFGHFSPKRSRRDQLAVSLVRARSGNKEGKHRVARGRTNRDAYYAGWVEFGHRIVPRKTATGSKFITARRREAKSTGRRVPPRPFLEPAYKSHGAQAFAEIERVMREGLIEAAR